MPSSQPQSKRRAARKSTNVPGQALGYSLQFTRFTHLLFTSPSGSFISFEVLDDVAVQTPGGQTTLIQSKSALTANPIADRAVSLWKTLANWADTVAAQVVDPMRLKLVVYISRQVDGEIARTFHDAQTREAANAALGAAHAKIAADVSDDARSHIDRFFTAPLDIRIAVVMAFAIECGSGSPQSDLETEVRARLIPEERLLFFTEWACGWVKRRVDKLLEQSKAAIISRDEFIEAMTVGARKYIERALLCSMAPAPSPDEMAALLPSNFVQQLQIIDREVDDQMEAISCFFRATADRTAWGEGGDVDPASLDELDSVLVTAWKNLKTIAFQSAQDGTPQVKGQLLLAQCMLHQAKLEGLEVPGHFMPGCFHLLADMLKVGWHPEYVNELKQRKQNPPT
jgi:hypothetical protein